MPRKEEPIISWADVTVLCHQVETTGSCHVEIKFVPCPAYHTSKTMTVAVKLTPVTTVASERRPVIVQGYFPQRRWRTATGCITGLLYDALNKLEARREEERSKAPRRLPGM